jgi:hypothetical protein
MKIKLWSYYFPDGYFDNFNCFLNEILQYAAREHKHGVLLNVSLEKHIAHFKQH